MNSKVRKYLTVITLGLAGGSIYFLPYVKYIFYDAQLAAMHMSNTQSGLLLTMYTVGNMILYIPFSVHRLWPTYTRLPWILRLPCLSGWDSPSVRRLYSGPHL